MREEGGPGREGLRGSLDGWGGRWMWQVGKDATRTLRVYTTKGLEGEGEGSSVCWACEFIGGELVVWCGESGLSCGEEKGWWFCEFVC